MMPLLSLSHSKVNDWANSQPSNYRPSVAQSMTLANETGSVPGRRKITLFGGISTIIALMIGAGIFSTTGDILSASGSTFASFAIWIICAGLGLTGALCYAELGTMIPGSGGEHQYILRAFGPLMAFVFDWTSLFILKPGTNAVFASAFGKYLIRLIYYDLSREQLEELMDRTETKWIVRGIGALSLIIATAAVGLSTKAADRAQNVFTWGKIFALASIIIGGIVAVARDPSIAAKNFENPMQGTTNEFTKMLFAVCQGLWAYEGWNNLNIVAGDLVNPSVNLPKAIGISVGSVVFLYLFTMLGYFTTVPKKDIRGNDTIGMTFAVYLFNSNYGSIAMALFVMFAVFGSTISNMISSAELVITIAEAGSMPKFLARKNILLNTPLNAILFQTFLSLILTAAGDFSWLIMVYTLPQWFFYGTCVCALFYLRWVEPELERPYRVWVFWTPILFSLACITIIIGVFISEWVGAVVSVSVMLISLPVGYFAVIRPQKKAAASLESSTKEESND